MGPGRAWAAASMVPPYRNRLEGKNKPPQYGEEYTLLVFPGIGCGGFADEMRGYQGRSVRVSVGLRDLERGFRG